MKVFLGIAIIVVLLLGVGLSLPFLIDLNKYQDRYRPLIEEALNRKITLQDIRLTIWPRIGARVGGFTVHDDPSFRSGAFASLSSVDVGVKLLPLLGGRIEVEEITLREPVIVILKNKAGVLNISTLGSQAPAAPKPEAPPGEPAGGPLRALALLAVDKVSLDGGKLTYRDESIPKPTEYALHNLEFLLTSVHLGETARLHADAVMQPRNIPVKLDGSFGPLTETLNIKHFDFDVGLGQVPISAKGGAMDGNLDITMSSPLINSTDIPMALPLTKPVHIKNLHVTAHLDYGQMTQAAFLDRIELKDVGLAVASGQSVVNVKGRAALGVAHITAASSEVSSDDLPIDLRLLKPVAIKNLHLSARARYPPREAASLLELADIADFGLAVVMGPSTADVQGTLNAGVAHATITCKGLNTSDLPVAIPLKKPVQITGLHATAEIRPQEARMKTLVFEVFNGSVKAQGTTAFGSSAPAFHAGLTAEGLQLQSMADVAGLTPLAVTGTAATKLDLRGRGFTMPHLTKALEGTGTIAVKDGKIERLNLTQEVSLLLKVAGLSADEANATAFSIINSNFSVRQGLITVQRLFMESHDFQITGNGTIGFDHTLHLRLNMDLSQSLSRRIAIASPFTKMALSGGRLSLPVIITGTIQAPSYGLDTKLFAGKAQEQTRQKAKETVEDLLQGRTTPEDLRQQGKSLLKDLFGR